MSQTWNGPAPSPKGTGPEDLAAAKPLNLTDHSSGRRADSAVPQGPCKVSLRHLTWGDGDQRPGSDPMSDRCALHLHGEHSSPPQVRATWRSAGRRNDPNLSLDRAPLRQHPSRSTARLTTLHEPCPSSPGRFGR